MDVYVFVYEMQNGLYTRVDISDTEYTPFDKAPTIKIPASQNWDPTDADAKR